MNGFLHKSSLGKYYRWGFFVLLALGLIVELGARVGAEVLWFQEVGYLPMYWLRLKTQGVLWVGSFTVAAAYLLGNLALAQRLKYPNLDPDQAGSRARPSRYPIVPRFLKHAQTVSIAQPLSLRWLLPLTLSLSLLVLFMLIHYGQVAATQGATNLNMLHSRLPDLILFNPGVFWSLAKQVLTHVWSIGLVSGSAIALLFYPRFGLKAIALTLSALLAWVLSRQWASVLLSLQPTSFQQNEPLFGRDISFYIFTLPVWELLEFWLIGLSLYGLIAVWLTYLLSGNSLSQGRFPGLSRPQQQHLYGLGAGLMLGVGWHYWLSRYKLLYSSLGVSYGASYTDITLHLPVNTGLSLLAVAIAVYLGGCVIHWPRQLRQRQLLVWGMGLYCAMIVGAGGILPILVQSLIVQPNELALERPYIQRTIALTRQAFGLESVETQTFNPQGTLTEQDLQANNLTIRNIRLWDEQPLLLTNRELQQIRLYYRFPDADIDRYTFSNPASSVAVAKRTAPSPAPLSARSPNQQQVLIAARELDYTALPKQAKTWVNEHLIYTHGYGFTLSPVNRVASSGLPEYFVKDIGITEGTPLTTSSEAVRASIPIGQPRIYYGELTNTYVMTGTKSKELDYPSGDDNTYNTYDGRGGISLGSPWRRVLFAKYLYDWRMMLTPEFLPETKLLFRRNINRRIRAIAPFLKFDSDPYLVAADAQSAENRRAANDPSYLHWVIDAYTTSDRYPYSDVGHEGINYIRNSVKVVVDAYHGSVTFYIADPHDPIIRTWAKLFPDLFKPLSAMPETLRVHMRYPVDFFKIQSERLMTYHMTDPQVFYNREDQWQIPNEVYGDKPQLVKPYYLITSLPSLPFEEFILLLPYTPQQRTNLIAWLAARSDGEHYGKLLLYVFPKQRLVYGTEQIEARINQDPVISQQISLWNRQGSRVIQGNLLVIPIEQSLLYVEPLYLESTQNRLPTLVRVIVAYENRIVMAPTLSQSLKAIFTPKKHFTPAIVRPVEDADPTRP